MPRGVTGLVGAFGVGLASFMLSLPGGCSSLYHIVGNLDLRPEAMALAGQDPVVGEIVGGVDIVLGQHHLALDALGRTRGAKALLAGRQRVQSGGTCRLKDALALLVRNLVHLVL